MGNDSRRYDELEASVADARAGDPVATEQLVVAASRFVFRRALVQAPHAGCRGRDPGGDDQNAAPSRVAPR